MFWILHLIALFVFPLALFITIPLHIIEANKSQNKGIDQYHYDLDAALQLAGVDEHRSLSLCHLIDSNGKVDVHVKKTLANMFLREKVTPELCKVIASEAFHIFKQPINFNDICNDFDKFKSSIKGF